MNWYALIASSTMRQVAVAVQPAQEAMIWRRTHRSWQLMGHDHNNKELHPLSPPSNTNPLRRRPLRLRRVRRLCVPALAVVHRIESSHKPRPIQLHPAMTVHHPVAAPILTCDADTLHHQRIALYPLELQQLTLERKQQLRCRRHNNSFDSCVFGFLCCVVCDCSCI